jgi:hypothetical protein
VFVWQGQRDGNVSGNGARYLAGALTNCRAEFYPDDAHLSLMMNHHREIFGALKNDEGIRLPSGAGYENLIS